MAEDWKLTGDGVFVVEGAGIFVVEGAGEFVVEGEGVLVEDPPCVPDGFGPNATYPKRLCD